MTDWQDSASKQRAAQIEHGLSNVLQGLYPLWEQIKLLILVSDALAECAPDAEQRQARAAKKDMDMLNSLFSRTEKQIREAKRKL